MVFVLLFYYEGLFIVVLEVISVGCDVLLSDIVLNVDIEVLSDCYFGVGNVNELVKKLFIFLNLNLSFDREVFL